MTTSLGRFLSDELAVRGETGEEFARRNGMNVSHVYQIIRGEKKNPQLDTVQKIAAGLGMTVAEMHAAMEGRSLAPDTANPRAHLVTLVHGVAEDDLPLVEQFLQRFVRPTPANKAHRALANRSERTVKKGRGSRNDELNPPLTAHSHVVRGVLPRVLSTQYAG